MAEINKVAQVLYDTANEISSLCQDQTVDKNREALKEMIEIIVDLMPNDRETIKMLHDMQNIKLEEMKNLYDMGQTNLDNFMRSSIENEDCQDSWSKNTADENEQKKQSDGQANVGQK